MIMSPDLSPVIVGGGSHARSLVAMAPIGLAIGRYVDFEDTIPTLRRLGNDETFLADPAMDNVPVIIGFVAPPSCSMAPRRMIIKRYASHPLATVIADDATVEPDTVVGAGTMIFHRAVINTGTFLGNHVIINTGAIIEHDVIIGENTFIGPGAIISGNVTIGRDTYIGAATAVRNGVTIGDGVTIGIGAVVVKDITEPGVYVGVPAKIMQK